MATKVLFIDRGGTLIQTPIQGVMDSVTKVRLLPDVIPALRRLAQQGYRFVMVTNQSGLGTPQYPQEQFDAIQDFLLALLESQGISFDAIFVCPHEAEENCGCRKPRPGLVQDYLANTAIDRKQSAVVGDQETDLELARNLGLRGFVVRADGASQTTWAAVAHQLIDQPRQATISRVTAETNIRVDVDLDERGQISVSTGLGFLDHMLEQLAKHGGFSLSLSCEGDLHVDDHHTVEDVALTLGQALAKALGDKRGIGRYGFLLPMDESQARVAIDLGGRPYAVFEGEFPRAHVGEMATELVPHFFQSLSQSLGAAIHISVTGDNTHHMVEAAFKGVARSLRQALAREGDELPSTKGVL